MSQVNGLTSYGWIKAFKNSVNAKGTVGEQYSNAVRNEMEQSRSTGQDRVRMSEEENANLSRINHKLREEGCDRGREAMASVWISK
jgi:hypothetical protein